MNTQETLDRIRDAIIQEAESVIPGCQSLGEIVSGMPVHRAFVCHKRMITLEGYWNGHKASWKATSGSGSISCIRDSAADAVSAMTQSLVEKIQKLTTCFNAITSTSKIPLDLIDWRSGEWDLSYQVYNMISFRDGYRNGDNRAYTRSGTHVVRSGETEGRGQTWAEAIEDWEQKSQSSKIPQELRDWKSGKWEHDGPGDAWIFKIEDPDSHVIRASIRADKHDPLRYRIVFGIPTGTGMTYLGSGGGSSWAEAIGMIETRAKLILGMNE